MNVQHQQNMFDEQKQAGHFVVTFESFVHSFRKRWYRHFDAEFIQISVRKYGLHKCDSFPLEIPKIVLEKFVDEHWCE